MDANGRFNWVYAFSWSEVDILKLEVQDLMMEMGPVADFNEVIYPVANKVADEFVRKQFADFNYLQIEPSQWAVATIWVLEIALVVYHAWLVRDSRKKAARNRADMSLNG